MNAIKGGKKKKKKSNAKVQNYKRTKAKIKKKNKKRSDFTFFFSRPKREFSKKKKNEVVQVFSSNDRGSPSKRRNMSIRSRLLPMHERLVPFVCLLLFNTLFLFFFFSCLAFALSTDFLCPFARDGRHIPAYCAYKKNPNPDAAIFDFPRRRKH